MTMTDPFADPASGFDRIQNYADCALIVTPRASLTGLTTKHSKEPGDTEAVDVDLVVLKADGTFQEIRMMRVYPKGLISQFRRSMDQMVIGRLGKVDTPKGPAWVLNPATEVDRALGVKYLEAKAQAKLQTPTPAPAMATAGSAPAGADPFA